MNFKEKIPTSCCSVELGTKIFAYVNLVLVSITILSSFILLVASVVMLAQQGAQGDDLYPPYLIAAVVAFIALFYSMIAIVFGGFLLAGVLKKKPRYIQVYVIYGIIKAVLSLISTVCLIFSPLNLVIVYIILIFLICIYFLILSMIWKTYRIYQKQHDQFDHQPLSERA